MQNQAQNPNQNLGSGQKQNQQPKKEPFSLMAVKTLLVVLIVAALGTIIIGGAYLIIKHGNGMPVNKILIEKCAKAGEGSSNLSLGPKNNPRECCKGLVEISAGSYYDPNNKYVDADENGCIRLVGSGNICSDCGNSVCESWENRCNCHKDCAEKEVIITTDKTEYEQGENVSVIIKNSFSEEMFISYPIVERIINDNYIPLKGSVVWPGCGVTGGLIHLQLEPSETGKHQWNQKEKWCSTDFSDRNVYSKEILSGKYRVKSEIIKRIKSEKEDPTNVSGKPSGEFIYSNEFTIKEKSALDPRCGERVVSEGNCEAEWLGYEFDQNKEICIGKFVSGCSAEIPFEILEECQEVCEKKEETTCNWCGRYCVEYPISENGCKAANGFFDKQCACPEIVPPKNLICGRENGKCVSKNINKETHDF